MVRLTSLAALFGLVGVLVAADPPKEPAGPTTDGKTPTEWAKLLAGDDADGRRKAHDALRRLAGNPDAVAGALLAAVADPEAKSAEPLRLLAAMGPRAVPTLTAALWSPDERARQVAFRTLAEIGPDARPATPALIGLLGSRDRETRIAAAEALRELEAHAAIPALARLLDDPDEVVRLAATTALGSLDADPAVLTPALTKLLDSGQERTAGLAVKLSSALGWGAAPAIPALAARVPNATLKDAPALAEALGRVGPPARVAVVPLKDRLKKDADAGLRYETAVAVWRIERDAAAVTILRDELATWKPGPFPVPAVLWRIDQSPETVAALEKLLRSDDPVAAATAAGLLGAKSKDAVPLLGRLLAHKDARVRSEAVVALTKFGPAGQGALEALKAARKDDVAYIAFWATAAACRLDPTADAVNAVAGFLSDPDPLLRQSAAEVLGQLGGAARPAAARLATARTDADAQTRLLAAVAGWKIDSNPAAFAPMSAALRDPDPEVRERAAVEIGYTVAAEGKALVPDLMTSLFDPVARTRSTAAEALGRMGAVARDAAPALAALVESDQPPFVHSAACEALKLIDPVDKDAAAGPLKSKLADPSPLTRAHAALSLFELTGDRAGEKVAARLLTHRSHAVRVTAAEYLWRAGKDERVVPFLAALLEESNLDGRGSENERYMVARLLGRIGAPAKPAVPELAKLVTHYDPVLASVAADALKAVDPDAAKKAGVK